MLFPLLLRFLAHVLDGIRRKYLADRAWHVQN